MTTETSPLILLPPELDIASIDALKAEFVAALDVRSNVTVSGLGVSRVTTPGALLLCSAARTFAAQDLEFSIVSPSETLTAALAGIGIADTIQVKDATP